MIRFEEDQTKKSEARIVPIPEVLVVLLTQVDSKDGFVFDTMFRQGMAQGLCESRTWVVHRG